MYRTLVFAALLSMVLVGAAGALDVGEPAPKFANPDLRGNYVRHATVIGKGWVVLSFFATWCGPCKEELPELEALLREAGPDRLSVLVFAIDENRADVSTWFAEHPTNTVVLLDPYRVTYDRYNPGESSVPTLFLVNVQGTIEMKETGYSPIFIARVRDVVLGTP